VTPLAKRTVGLRNNVPCSRHLESRGPHDVGHVGPDTARLMREHDDLNAILRHALIHTSIGSHHTSPETLVLAFDCKSAATVPDRKLGWRVFAKPGDEEIEDLLVLYGITVRRICNVDVVRDLELVRGCCDYNVLHAIRKRVLLIALQEEACSISRATTTIDE